MPNTYLVSLGCDKNRVDGEVMIGSLRLSGYIVVQEPENAQVIIVNTCGFIRDAVQESIDLILELAQYKAGGSCRALVVVGCMAARYRDEISESIPEVDVIVGVGEYDGIAGIVEKLVGPGNAAARTDATFARIAARKDDIAPHIAYIKIAEGCNSNCTYCTIPAIRGAYVSRPMQEISKEAKELVAAGAKELVLVAQDTTLYGVDIYNEKMLPCLLEELASNSGAQWIRLMYAYPEHITQELIDTMAKLPQVCKYIDMPIQHSEDTVLARMGRAGNCAALLARIASLRNAMPDIAIRTTLITGFPGETVEDFKNMYRFVRDIKFDRLGVFPYSREAGTPAATMPQQVRKHIKHARMQRLMALQQGVHFAAQEAKVGTIASVIVDELNQDGTYTGRTQHDAYDVDAVVIFKSDIKLAQGDICAVRITAADGYDLRGQYEPTK